MIDAGGDQIAALEAEIARLRRLLAKVSVDATRADAVAAGEIGRLTGEIASRAAVNAGLRRDNADLIESSALMRSVFAASDDCITVLDLDGRLIFMSEGGQRVMEVDDFSVIANCPWPDFWMGNEHVAASEAIAAAKSGGSSRFRGIAPTLKGSPRYWDVLVMAIPDESGAPARLLSISRDITGIRKADEDVATSGRMLRLFADAMPALIGYIDRGRRFGFANRAYELLLKRPRGDIVGRTVEELFGDDRLASQMHLLDRALAGEQVREQRRFVRPNGRPRWTDTRLIPRPGPNGEVIGAFVMVMDVTEQKTAEEQRQLLTQELTHRVKNTLAMVGAIANQTLRPPATIKTAAQTFIARLATLGQAHDLLTQASWSGAHIRPVIEDALAPHRTGEGRFTLDGPNLRLPARRALSLALAIHELATNAAKYGALSNDSGRVSLAWEINPDGGERWFRLTWRESGGPPVAAPARRGFGSRLIERSLASDWGGEAVIKYEPDGVIFELTAPKEGG